ncbi:MAG: enoyl-CoA hydratase/isomerase family protein [Deltaproteobacteria bacterium]|nr:enoyl-CoA hydratase/isomerase family protein [Deltaproteobacteria bacterium]
MIDLQRQGSVFVLTMQSGENRFNRPFLNALTAALDEVEASTGPAALVTTGSEKFFSNGLDLTWLMGDGVTEGGAFISDVIRMLGRVLGFPVPTVAAINGHAFAGGGMLALAHDFRIMRVDRGFFCLPEVDIKLPLAPGMSALIKTRLSGAVLRDAVLTGARIGGAEAHERGIVDAALPADEVLPTAIARVAALADKDRTTYAALKRGLYGETLAIMQRGELP